MAYTATRQEDFMFHMLHSRLSEIIRQYKGESDSGIEKKYPTWMSDINGIHYFDYVVTGKSLFRRKPVIKIAPPFQPSDIDIRDPRYSDLANQLREEIFLFWTFGRPDEYRGEKDETAERLAFRYNVSVRASEISGVEDPPDKAKISAISEIEAKRFLEYLQAVN